MRDYLLQLLALIVGGAFGYARLVRSPEMRGWRPPAMVRRTDRAVAVGVLVGVLGIAGMLAVQHRIAGRGLLVPSGLLLVASVVLLLVTVVRRARLARRA